jgi:hypothetical protein
MQQAYPARDANVDQKPAALTISGPFGCASPISSDNSGFIANFTRWPGRMVRTSHGGDAQPADEAAGRELGFARPAVDEVDDLVAGVVGSPLAIPSTM